MKFYADLELAQIMEQVATMWDMTTPLPVPKWDITCPVCDSVHLMIKEMKVGHREQGNYRRGKYRGQHRLHHRVDIYFKCVRCSASWHHGIPINETAAYRYGWDGGNAVTYTWREVKRILEQ